jgi:hypothetical protein
MPPRHFAPFSSFFFNGPFFLGHFKARVFVILQCDTGKRQTGSSADNTGHFSSVASGAQIGSIDTFGSEGA